MSAVLNDEVISANLSVKRLGVFVGAQVTGIDLSQRVDSGTAQQLQGMLAEYGMLAFPNQVLSSEEFMAFARTFGTLSVHPFSSSTKERPELIVYDNKNENPPGSTDIWHTDETFREAPPMATSLCSKIMPEVGGDTAFVNMNAVYEGLSTKMQNLIEGMEAVHDFKPFKTLFPKTPEGLARLRQYEDQYPPATHPLVTLHPVTGKKVLFVNPLFTLFIKGLQEDESRAILEMLYRKTYIQEYQYRHRWQTNMVVIWDNRLVQHSALHDYYPNRRMLERVTVMGTKPVAATPPADPADLRRFLMPPITAFEGVRQKRQHEM